MFTMNDSDKFTLACGIHMVQILKLHYPLTSSAKQNDSLTSVISNHEKPSIIECLHARAFGLSFIDDGIPLKMLTVLLAIAITLRKIRCDI